jgi:hypothetical protein
MPLDSNAISVLTRPLPKDKIQTRPGKGGLAFSYITPDFVIDILNEAFGSEWNTRIVSHAVFADNVAVVGLELSVPTTDGKYVAKQQFGSCEITRGLDVGSAFKGAASDALKKCATLLGLGLELYKDEEPVASPTPPQFRTPPAPAAPRPSSPAPAAPRLPVAAPSARPVAPPAPPKPAAPPAPKLAGNPFSGTGAANPAPLAKPTPPPARPVSVPAPAAPRTNPFTSNAEASGPNSTQLNAMTNLANRKGLTPSALIALAAIVDGHGQPVGSFEELTREQAIQVIKAAQL